MLAGDAQRYIAEGKDSSYLFRVDAVSIIDATVVVRRRPPPLFRRPILHGLLCGSTRCPRRST